MSYRETKNLLEKLRTMGYASHQLTMDSFTYPNFGLVADLLKWLVKSYDPQHSNEFSSSNLDSVEERVHFIQSIVRFMATKAHLKLNPRKLYSADGYAVQELLKICNLLTEASRQAQAYAGKEENIVIDKKKLILDLMDPTQMLTELRGNRQLSVQVGQKGAELHDLTASEVELRDHRLTSISTSMDLQSLQQYLQQNLAQLQSQILKHQQLTESLYRDEELVKQRVERRRGELERRTARLKSMMAVRPAFMDDYEKLESQLKQIYAIYVESLRNLAYLEYQLEQHDQKELESLQESEKQLKQLQQQLKQEELDMLKSGGATMTGSESFDGAGAIDSVLTLNVNSINSLNDKISNSNSVNNFGSVGSVQSRSQSIQPSKPAIVPATNTMRKPVQVVGSLSGGADDSDGTLDTDDFEPRHLNTTLSTNNASRPSGPSMPPKVASNTQVASSNSQKKSLDFQDDEDDLLDGSSQDEDDALGPVSSTADPTSDLYDF